MTRFAAIGIALLLTPTLAHGDEKAFIPTEFPQRIAPFWWGESIASARSRCEKFLPQQKQPKAFICVLNDGSVYRVGFDKKTGKLATIGFPMGIQEYEQCDREVAALIQSGPQVDGASGKWRAGSRSEYAG